MSANQIPKLPQAKPQGEVAQTCLSAGSRDFPVPWFRSGTGDWKPNVGLRVARTCRLESLRYLRSTIRLRNSDSTIEYTKRSDCASQTLVCALVVYFLFYTK